MEFENQGNFILPHTMPLMSAAVYVIDVLPMQRRRHTENLLGIFNFDSMCTREDPEENPGFTRLIEKHWDPLLKWFEREFNIKMPVNYTLGHDVAMPSSEASEVMRAILDSMDDYTFLAHEHVTHLSKSNIISLALIRNRLTVDQCVRASMLEEHYNLEVSGRVDGPYGTQVQENFAKLRVSAAKTMLHLANLDI